jgi:hypothetical protein
LVTRPFVAHSQQPTHVARIGYVSGTGSAADPGPFVDALQQGMREHGYRATSTTLSPVPVLTTT